MTAPRRLLLAMTALAILSSAAGCDGQPRNLSIGVLVAQSGPSGARGKDLLDGALLAAEEINAADFRVDGRPLHVDIRATDDKGEVEPAKSQARDLIDTGIAAMIGPVNSNQAAAVIPIVAARGLPQLITATSAALPALGQGNVLRLLANDDQQGRAIASFAAETLAAKRIALVAESSDYGRGLNASVGAALHRLQRDAVISAQVDDKGQVAPETIARFRQAGVDTIVFLAREPQLMGVLDALESSGWTDVAIVGTNVVRNRSVARRPLRVKGLYATATAIDAREFPEGKAFLEAFRKRFDAEPVWGAQYAYDAVYALADAARQARTLDPAELVQTLKRIDPGTKVNQQMRFAASGEQVYPNIGVYKVDRGTWAMQMMSATW
ncbi:MAG TPA: branched-chain amino acid ABC transporter substrate-binding protein [Burkholderiaceae bacterium]